jgi:ABC-2 type transport system permease protein
MRKGVLRELAAAPVWAIADREWSFFRSSAIGVVFLIIFLAATGHLTFEPGRGSFFLRGQADLRPFFDYLPWVLAFFIPAMTMRPWAEERKSGTIEFLLTLPLSHHQAVWGKFWAAWKFLGVALLLTFPIVLTLFFLGSPDVPAIVTGYVGAWLLAGQMIAMGLFASAISRNQVTSFIIGALLLVISLLLDSPSLVDPLDNVFSGYPLALIENLSLLRHFEPWTKGVVKLGGLAVSLVSIVFWNWATAVTIDKLKAQ